MNTQTDLFGMSDADLAAPGWPDGLVYRAGFISPAEEAALLAEFATLPFAPARYKGYTARRQVVGFGGSYDYDAQVLRPAEPIPELLFPLRQRAAEWLAVAPEELQHALVALYEPGTPLGWHRDVPDFESIVGISLAGNARMRFRRHVRGDMHADAPADTPASRRHAADVLNLDLAPRSAYFMNGAARWEWQHSVAPTAERRFSVTFRTCRDRSVFTR